jgi:hypothetical protein
VSPYQRRSALGVLAVVIDVVRVDEGGELIDTMLVHDALVEIANERLVPI